MAKYDNTSVGLIVEDKDGKFLIIERMKYPFGFAAPAGHLDGDTFEAGLVREVKEEVGLDVQKYKKVLDQRFDNPCRREGGNWHHWQVYRADEWSGEVKRSPDETKQALWLSRSEIGALAERTEAYVRGKISESEWQARPGLEAVWYEIFKLLQII